VALRHYAGLGVAARGPGATGGIGFSYAHLLREWGRDYAQGFLIHQLAPATGVSPLLAERARQGRRWFAITDRA
jgi:hypothetical protein